MGRRSELERYPLEQITKWRRIANLITKVDDLLEIEEDLLEGNEDEIRDFIRGKKTTRRDLVAKAQILGIKNYGHLTKRELDEAIRSYEGNTRAR